jgi:Mrp family chromosome partitioning ATPase
VKNSFQAEQSLDKVCVNLMALIKRTKKKISPIVVLVSQNTGEGVTSVAFALLNVIKNSGNIRLLLIDADHKGIRASTLLKIDESLNPDNAFIVVPTNQGFDYLNMDYLPVTSAKLEQWQLALNNLQDEYDLIIVDAGSLDSNNAYHWLNYDCYAILVIDATTSTEETLTRLSQRLQSAGIKMSGFLLNKRPFPIPKFMYKYLR